MGEDVRHSRDGHQNHHDQYDVEQAACAGAISWRRFHWEIFRTAGARKLSTEIRRFGEMVVRDISPASGRIIASRYNLSCSFNTTFVVILDDRIGKVD